jgi:hypothetical protein
MPGERLNLTQLGNLGRSESQLGSKLSDSRIGASARIFDRQRPVDQQGGTTAQGRDGRL